MGKHETDAPKLEHLARHGSPCVAICAGKHCARGGAKQIIRAAQAALDEAGLATAIVLTQCQDYCDDGPVLTVLPGGYPYTELRPHTARQVILEHLRDGAPVLALLPKKIRRRLERRQARNEEVLDES